MLRCKEASRLISDKEERPLRWHERWGLRLHLLMCVSCSRFEAQIRLLRRALPELGRHAQLDSDKSSMPPQVRARILKVLEEWDQRGP